MKAGGRSRIALVTMATLCTVVSGWAASTPAQKCTAGKNKAAGKYAGCLQSALGKFALSGDGVKLTADTTKCGASYGKTWARLELKGSCPSIGDVAPVANLISLQATNIATDVAGGPLSNPYADLSTCQTDLSTCQTNLAACLAACPAAELQQTGQAFCTDSS